MKIKSPLLGYKVGLAIIGLFVVGLTVFVVAKANTVKQDVGLTKKAQDIAFSFNKYVEKNNKGPESLSTVYKKDIPDAITYKKLPDHAGIKQYEFCINYQASTAENVSSDVSNGIDALRGGDSQFEGLTDDVAFTGNELSVSDAHHKGKNCQTIWVSITPAQYDTQEPSNPPSKVCGEEYEGAAWSAVQVKSITSPKSGEAGSIFLDAITLPDTFTLDTNVKVFDFNKCQKLSIGDVQPGDFVTLYFDADNMSVPIITEP